MITIQTWRCATCGCAFPDGQIQDYLLDTVTRCTKCVEVDVLRRMLTKAQQERDELRAERDLLLTLKDASQIVVSGIDFEGEAPADLLAWFAAFDAWVQWRGSSPVGGGDG